MFRRRATSRVNGHKDDESIGNILVRMGAVTKDQLATAVGHKSYHDEMLLGSVLKQLHLCTDTEVARALTIQAQIRSGARAMAELEVLEARVEKFAEGEKVIGENIGLLHDGESRMRREIEERRRAQREDGALHWTWWTLR